MDDRELEVMADGGRTGFAVEAVEVREVDCGETGPAEAQGGLAGARVAERWSAYVADAKAWGVDLFNGAVSCLRRTSVEAGKVLLEVGQTDYRQFVVTTLRDRAWFAAHAPAAIREALGNSVLLVRGEEALLGNRSGRVSAYGGRAHLIGGVLEVLKGGRAGVEGVVDHLRMELREEAGVEPGELVGRPRLLAVVRDLFLQQPELAWVWETSGDLREIGRRMAEHEHSGFVVVGRAGVEARVWEQMTPVARETWARWSGRRWAGRIWGNGSV